MTLALATRGYVCVGGVQPGVLAYLHPESATVRQNSQLLMAVVLTSPAPGDQTVALLSNNTAVVTVPASVVIPDGQVVATFYATSHQLGVASVTATLDTVVKAASIEVIAVDESLKPKVHAAVELRPSTVAARVIRPTVYDAEVPEVDDPKPRIHEAKELKPRGVGARNLRPKIIDTEES